MNTTSNLNNRQKVTIYNPREEDHNVRVGAIIMLHENPEGTSLSSWQRKVLTWLIKFESKVYKKLYPEDQLFRSEIYLAQK